MWKYLKDYVVARLLDKWILSTEPSNTHNDATNSEAFLHYQNIDLNSSSLNESVLKNKNFKISKGKIDELNVNINWKEVFRYWTEIRAKYHIETSDDDDEEYGVDDNTIYEDSLIRMKGLSLYLSKVNENFESEDDQPIVDSPGDVDLMKDFVNHIMGQFRVEIIDVTIILNETFSFNIPSITLLPENNGLRRITINEDITMSSSEAQVRILKGTEILIMRTIERTILKVKVLGIDIEAADLDSLMAMAELFTVEGTGQNGTNTTVELSIDALKLSINSLTLTIHDIWLNNTDSFIIGHFNLKLNDYSVLMSPIQTHVVTGDFKKMRMVVEEEIVVRLRDIKQIEDIMEMFKCKALGKSDTVNTILNVHMRSLVVVLDGIDTVIEDIILRGNTLSIANIKITYKESHMNIIGMLYIMRSEQTPFKVTPFAELKRFIENDEIISIEDESVLYGMFEGLVNSFEIESIVGTVNFEDILDFASRLTESTNDTSNNDIFTAMGKIKRTDFTLKLPNDVVYKSISGRISILKAEGFVDLRSHLMSLTRNEKPLIHSADIVVVKTEDLNILTTDNLNLIIPFNLNEQLADDLKSICDFESKTNSGKSVFQLTLKNSIVKLETPNDLIQPIESEFHVKEVNCKTGVLYLSEAILKLADENILNSGLIKIIYDSKTIEIMNHCSTINLTQKGYRNLINFVTFWSEIYSPVIEEIQPEAVFRCLSETEGINGTLMQFEGEEGEDGGDIELELDFTADDRSDTDDTESADNGNNNGAGYEYDSSSVTDNNAYTSIDLEKMLEDIDNEFFITKQNECQIENSFVKLTNFGVKINLISDDNFVISLTGIDGSITDKGLNLKFKEGSIHKTNSSNNSSKIIMHRWPRGPDVTCKYPIEDGNFISIKAEKLGIKNDAGIDEYNLSISVCPLRLFLDQKSLNGITSFFTNETIKSQASDKLRGFIFFNKVSISPLALKIDYNPNSTSPTAPIPLQGAEMILPRVELRGVKGLEGLGPTVFSAWIPEVKGKKLTGVLATGLVPVRTIVNLGGGVAELILLPWQLGSEQSAAQTVAQIRKNGKIIGLETLKLTASLANRTSKLLSTQTPNTPANYPKDFQSGVQQAAQLIIALPTRLSQSKNGALRAVPLMVLDSAATATGAVAKTLQGIQAEFDREIDYERKIKRNN